VAGSSNCPSWVPGRRSQPGAHRSTFSPPRIRRDLKPGWAIPTRAARLRPFRRRPANITPSPAPQLYRPGQRPPFFAAGFSPKHGPCPLTWRKPHRDNDRVLLAIRPRFPPSGGKRWTVARPYLEKGPCVCLLNRADGMEQPGAAVEVGGQTISPAASARHFERRERILPFPAGNEVSAPQLMAGSGPMLALGNRDAG